MTFVGMFKNIIYVVILLALVPLIPLGVSYLTSTYARYFDPRTTVAVIPVKGMLDDATSTIKHLHAYFKDSSVKAIVLKVDCPGGKSGTSQAIYEEILALKKDYPKPIISSVENICASGAYYIVCATDHIIATPSALIGSIGIRFSPMSEFQLKEFIEQYKIHYKPMKAGTYKTAGDMFADRTSEETALLQNLLNDSYDQFVGDVAKNRKLSVAQASTWADGKIFTGRQAQKLGLVDQLGATSALIAAVKEKALIEGDIRWIHPTSPGSMLKNLIGGSDDDQGVLSSVVNECCNTIEARYTQASLQ